MTGTQTQMRFVLAGAQAIAEGPCSCLRCGLTRAVHHAYPEGLACKDASVALSALAEMAGHLLAPLNETSAASFADAVRTSTVRSQASITYEGEAFSIGRAGRPLVDLPPTPPRGHHH